MTIRAGVKILISENGRNMRAARQGFQLVIGGEAPFLQALLLGACPGIDHAFSTRAGGCSRPPFDSLNLAYHTGDDHDFVMENRRRFFKRWDYGPESLTAGRQVHGTGISYVTGRERGYGAAPGTSLADCDALVTDIPEAVLGAFAADCLLLFFVEPALPVIALAHAGWRGTLGGMAPKVVAFLQERFAIQPHRLLVAIGPSICKRCYAVGSDLAHSFAGEGWAGPPYLEPRSSGGLFSLDLAAINFEQLLRAGLVADNIAACNWCTSCRPDLFFSHRRDGGATGRMIGFLAIRNTAVRER